MLRLSVLRRCIPTFPQQQQCLFRLSRRWHSTNVIANTRFVTELERIAAQWTEGMKKAEWEPRLLPAIAGCNIERHFVCCPIDDLQKILVVMKSSSDRHMFLKSAIGTGKSTLAQLLKEASRDVVYVSMKTNTTLARTLIESEVDCHSHTDIQLSAALKGKLLIIDECHLMFGEVALLSCL